MPIGELNVRLLTIQQEHYKPIPGCTGSSSTFQRFVYPDEINATPEELFEQFKGEAVPEVFEELEIPDGTVIDATTHCKIFCAFSDWLVNKGFRRFYELERQLPMFEIPAQVTLTDLRSHRRSRY
jgi:hypothetical protein